MKLVVLVGILSLVASLILSLPFLRAVAVVQGTEIVLTQTGQPEWYRFSFGRLTPIEGPRGFEDAPLRVLEAVPFGAGGDQAVLGRVEGTSGIVLGVLHADGTFSSVLADGTRKAGLSVNSEGTAAYMESLDVFTPDADADGTFEQEPAPDSNPEGYDPADFLTPIHGMVADDLPVATSSLELAPVPSRITTVSLTASEAEPVYHGDGRYPRFASDGSLLALTLEGLVRIDTSSGERTVLLARGGADQGLLSSDASLVFLPTIYKTDVYRIEAGEVTLIGSLAEGSPIVALSGDRYAIAKPGGEVRVYDLDTFKGLGFLFPITPNTR